MLPSPKYLTQVVISLLSFAIATTQGLGTVRRATVCNGHAELCERSYGSVSFVGAHDSYAVGSPSILSVNQDQNITQQLNDGIRLLQMQAHTKNGVIHLCHSSCDLFDGGSLEDYLKTVETWMDANPNEVLSLLIVNIENLAAAQYDAVFKAASVDTMSFAPESSPLTASAWPTLGSMIDSGKRLVTFLDNGADPSVPYIIDEFTNVWETAFNVVDAALFDCSVNRTKGDPTTQLYLINHFLDKLLFNQPIPDIANLGTTNSASGPGSLGAHVDTCVSLNTRPPNFLLVDFYEYGAGSVFQVAATINGVQYSPATPVATPLPTSAPENPPSGNSATSITDRKYILALIAILSGIAFGARSVL